MCGGGGVEDNSHLVAEQSRISAREAREAELAETRRQEQEFERRLNTAFSGARSGVDSFFNERGLDPTQFESLISGGLNRAKSAVPFLDTSPGTHFDGLGERLFDEGSNALRARSTRELDQFAGDGFARRLVSDDLDDSAIAAILDEQFAQASSLGDGLLRRGVINETGFNGALSRLEKQRAAAGRRLTEIGDSVLETQRSNLRDIAGDARSRASGLNLGDLFDVNETRSQIDSSFDDFVSGLGDNLRGFVPEDLFDVSDFAVNAGAAQGAQNLNFDPRALSGIFDAEEEGEDEDENEFSLDGLF